MGTPDTLRFRRVPVTQGFGATPAAGIGGLIADPLDTQQASASEIAPEVGPRHLDCAGGDQNKESTGDAVNVRGGAAVVQLCLASAERPMASGAATQKGDAAPAAEVDGKLRRGLDLPTSAHPAATPRKTLRERLRRPLLIVLPGDTGRRRRGVLSGRGALRLDRRCLRPRGEGIGQRPGWRPSGRNCRQGQSARPARPAPVPDRPGAIPDRGRSGRGAARQRPSADRRA